MKIRALALAFTCSLLLGCASADTGPDPCKPGETYDAELCEEKQKRDAERAERRRQRQEQRRFPDSGGGRRPGSY